MEPTYVYVKPRAEFGRQCFFDSYGPVIDEDIQPDHLAYQDYIQRNPCHVASQKPKQYAVHEVQVSANPVKSTGMLHFEGGWPRDINPKDEEATARFRRRTEKEDDWAPKLRHLLRTMEHGVRQNNAVDIYEHYFDDIEPANLKTPHNLRVVNVYTVPQLKKEPVNWIAWSPDRDTKIIVSYCVMDFQKITEVQGHSYVWSVENSNVPVSLLKTFSPLVVSEYHPRDCRRVASGLMTGQVCVWDLRKSMKPVAFSRSDSSHRYPISSLKWIQSKNGYEFFTSSYDGQVMWWDMRNLQKPTSILTFDLENPRNPRLDHAFGVSCMNFEPTLATKFLIGLENGVTISGSRKSINPEEKMSLRFDSHYGPVISIDRNRSIPKCFLTIGDWTARVWSEDTKEGGLVSTRYFKKFLTGGCWSRSRHSLFYTINRTGHLKSWDLLQDLQTPVTSLRLCNDLLTVITHHEDEAIMAIGSTSGNVYLVEASEGLVRFSKDEKSNFVTYIDRCSRFAKAMDVRRRELKLYRRMTTMEDNRRRELEKELTSEMSKSKRKSIREKKLKDKFRSKEHYLTESQILNDPELLDAEKAYFRIINEELSKFDHIVDPDDDYPAKERPKVKKQIKDRRVTVNMKLEKTRLRKKSVSPKYKNEIVILKKSKVSDIQKTEEVHNPINSNDSSKSLISKEAATKTKVKVLPGPLKMPHELKPLSSKICKAPCAMEICCKDISYRIKSKKQEDKQDEKLLRNLTGEQEPDAEMKTWRRIPAGLGSSETTDSLFTQDEKMEILRNITAPPEKMTQIFTRRMSHVVNKTEPD